MRLHRVAGLGLTARTIRVARAGLTEPLWQLRAVTRAARLLAGVASRAAGRAAVLHAAIAFCTVGRAVREGVGTAFVAGTRRAHGDLFTRCGIRAARVACRACAFVVRCDLVRTARGAAVTSCIRNRVRRANTRVVRGPAPLDQHLIGVATMIFVDEATGPEEESGERGSSARRLAPSECLRCYRSFQRHVCFPHLRPLLEPRTQISLAARPPTVTRAYYPAGRRPLLLRVNAEDREMQRPWAACVLFPNRECSTEPAYGSSYFRGATRSSARRRSALVTKSEHRRRSRSALRPQRIEQAAALYVRLQARLRRPSPTLRDATLLARAVGISRARADPFGLHVRALILPHEVGRERQRVVLPQDFQVASDPASGRQPGDRPTRIVR